MASASPPRGRRRPPPPPEEAEAAGEGASALTPRRTRLPRACNSRPKVPSPSPPPPPPRPERARRAEKLVEEEMPKCRVVTPLVAEPEAPAELPRWRLRCMWELASVINFLHVFRPLLNIAVEFTAEELEEAIISPNNTLYDIHIPLLKSIPPVTRMAMGRETWVTVLCRKLKYWWNWVAEGDLPIVASHGEEIKMYNALEPATRLVILKVICDIRCEQEDVRNFIDSSLKRGCQLPVFRKERIGGNSYGISYWYDEDPVLGHRLYREIRQVEYVQEPAKKSKGKGVSSVPVVSYQWETVACNFDEFEVAAEKLFSSRNRTEASLGKKLKINYLPEIEKTHKKKERLLKKQLREAILLGNCFSVDGFTSVRSRRERKRVTYTFDDYERSINEAIKTTKKNDNSDEIITTNRRVHHPKRERANNSKLASPSPVGSEFYGEYPPKYCSHQESDVEKKPETLVRSYRQRKRSQWYTQDFVEAVSDIDPDFESDDDIMGEAVYDEEYLRSRKQHKTSPEDDEEFQLEQVANDGNDEVEYPSSSSEDEKEPQRYKRLATCSPRDTKLRIVDKFQTVIRRSKRSTRPHTKYKQWDLSGTDAELGKQGKTEASGPDAGSDALNGIELSATSQDQEEQDAEVNKEWRPLSLYNMPAPGRDNEIAGRRFLDLNELAPAGGYDETQSRNGERQGHG
ncbi:hypothetical protein GUJ93_ZPchr0013g34342 [Zizania palustris]|uniref:DDT domain-containing protein n=1 Tax=Zizania palustris TaxID=103762 RepID=A0A8J5WZN9_ZIZPA|nr:hypothetical protein GUJ93_ZPchr0013g34342 [Zizania palustris]